MANADLGWQTTESEMSAANQWTAPVSVSANPSANPQTAQQASAALANPGTAPITVRGTLYDKNGLSVTFRDFQVPALGAIALVFSQDPSEPFGGFGQAMFPGGQDFNGLVSFQVKSPSGGSVSAMVLQYVGNAMSSVEVNSQGLPAVGAQRDSLRGIPHGRGWVMFRSIHASLGGFRRRLGKPLESGQSPKPLFRRRTASLYAVSRRIRKQRFTKPFARLFHRQSHGPDTGWRERKLYVERRSIGGCPLPVSAGWLR